MFRGQVEGAASPFATPRMCVCVCMRDDLTYDDSVYCSPFETPIKNLCAAMRVTECVCVCVRACGCSARRMGVSMYVQLAYVFNTHLNP